MCYKLTSIDIPEGVTSIGDNAFYYCTGITSIDLPDSVTNIGAMAFYGCSSLTTVNYRGTEEQFNAITIGSSNTPFMNATKVYEYTGP